MDISISPITNKSAKIDSIATKNTNTNVNPIISTDTDSKTENELLPQPQIAAVLDYRIIFNDNWIYFGSLLFLQLIFSFLFIFFIYLLANQISSMCTSSIFYSAVGICINILGIKLNGFLIIYCIINMFFVVFGIILFFKFCWLSHFILRLIKLLITIITKQIPKPNNTSLTIYRNTIIYA